MTGNGTLSDISTDPVASAKAAGLRYVNDRKPGITRERAGKYWSYIGPDGQIIRDRETRARIKSLGIPPAWTDVWICPNPEGHIQATGRDARGRKQYRYHPQWREVRDETKYGRMIEFGKALPLIRKRVEKDLAKHGLPRDKVLATVVKLLETTLIRIGNEEYARTNKSFGLTTMRNRHVDVRGATLRFKFNGKSGKQHTVGIKNRRLGNIVERCHELPGHELFQYIADDGKPHPISSEDVNNYLREITGQDFTAKDFRTWTGTVLAAMSLQEFEAFDSEAQAKKNIMRAIESVAEKLGNTPTICRECYVHPQVLDSYLEGTLLETLKERVESELTESLGHLRPEEAAVLAFLQQRLARVASEA
ncbi:MAG TPA: DNA topoisomerase IB [Chloroflexia bacterium]|nr:DNA topoisomerase IB [Chloroflexia bacterium]